MLWKLEKTVSWSFNKKSDCINRSTSKICSQLEGNLHIVSHHYHHITAVVPQIRYAEKLGYLWLGASASHLTMALISHLISAGIVTFAVLEVVAGWKCELAVEYEGGTRL